MSAAARPEGVPALVPLRQAIAPASHPALLYLANLRPSGRRTMRGALKATARVMAGCSLERMPWHLVRYEHAAMLRAVLQQRFAPATVNKHLTALRGVVRECWRLGQIDAERMNQVVDVPNVKAATLPSGRMLEREELEVLWKNASARERTLLAFLFAAGLRRSEASAINRDDVLVADDVVRLTVLGGKGGKDRTVSLSGKWAEAVKQRLEEPFARRVLGLGPTGIYERLRRMLERVQLPPASPHDLRRSYISHSLDAGVDLATVARMAGHADPRTTGRYDRRGERAERSAADALASFMDDE